MVQAFHLSAYGPTEHDLSGAFVKGTAELRPREGRAELVGRVELQFAERLEGRCQPGWIWVEYKFTDEPLLECLGLGLDSFFWVLVTGGIFHSRGIIRKQQCIMDGHSVQLDWRRRLKPGRISSRIQEHRTGDILNRQFAVRTTGVV